MFSKLNKIITVKYIPNIDIFFWKIIIKLKFYTFLQKLNY